MTILTYDPNYYPGKGCLCAARNQNDCACIYVDWTDPEVYRLRSYLQGLLATIHRDGGHYTDKYGLEQSVIDAEVIVCKLLVQI